LGYSESHIDASHLWDPFARSNRAKGLDAFSEVREQASNPGRHGCWFASGKNSMERSTRQLRGVLPDRYSLAVETAFPISGDQKLIQIVDAALADAARRSQGWLVCRKGCTPCCVGVFAINQLDRARLQRGLKDLAMRDPARAESVSRRARQ